MLRSEVLSVETSGMPETPDTVLLVDDEQAILQLLGLAFKKAQIPVKTALTAEEALKFLEVERFGAVVTDKNLPGASGLVLLKKVSEIHPHCARIMMTGFVSTESVLEALKLGADDYLLKPFENLMLLVERVKQVMKYRRTQADREALAVALREMEKSLRKSEAAAMRMGTEVELFQSVLELRIEAATRPLQLKIDALEAQLRARK